MAEGLTNQLKGDKLTAYSAGVETHGLNPNAVAVMAEVGIDISKNTSKLVSDFPADLEFDYVVTVCGHANENCPYFPAKTKVVHVGFDDPPALTREMTDREEILSVYRRVRDEIKTFVEKLPESMND